MTMEKLIHAAVFTPLRGGRWGLPALFRSVPGAAKTDMIEQFAAQWGFPCVTLSPGMQGEGAFGTTPVPYSQVVKDVKTMMLGYPAPEYVAKLTAGGLVFLDEISSTDVALQAPLLGILQARQVGFYKFHPRVRVIAAGNPIELAANGTELAASVANRMGWFDWIAPDPDDWASWLVSSGDSSEPTLVVRDAIAEEARVLAAWPDAWAKASGYVAAFITRKGRDMLSRCPKIGDPSLSGAWPSHRTWEYATRSLASSYVHGLDKNLAEMMVGAFVGEGPRDELFTFMDAQDLASGADYLDGNVAFEHDPKRLDRTYTILQLCTATVVPPTAQKRVARAEALWKIIRFVDSAGGFDLTEPACVALTKAGLFFGAEAEETLANQRDMLEAVGLGPRRKRP